MTNVNSQKPRSGQSDFDRAMTHFFDLYGRGCAASATEWWYALKQHPLTTMFVTGGVCGAIYSLTHYLIYNFYHLHLLNYWQPEFFTPDRLNSMLRSLGIETHHNIVLIFLGLIIFPIFGAFIGKERKRLDAALRNMGLTNGRDETPSLLRKSKLDYGRVRYTFDSKGIGIGRFRNLQDSIAAAFSTPVESIDTGSSPRYVAITLSGYGLPEHVCFKEMDEHKKLSKESFYAGISATGPVTVKAADMPHMLIAGTTGSGKSRFFKQALVGLLQSTPKLQMYLIDLKRGLEMTDLKAAPNVRIVSDLNQAVRLLKKLEKEMQDRFAYLEKKGVKQIVPSRDRKDRIVIAIDECSVLYANRSKNDPEYDLVCEARRITDNIAKLSRAAGIHLFMATQKLQADVIATTISDNISGRMCLRLTPCREVRLCSETKTP